MNKILFLDCESAGLRGEIFAAALVDSEKTVIFDGFYRHADLATNTWLRENVEPNLTGTEYPTRAEFMAAFAAAYEGCRPKYGVGEYNALQVCAHCGTPVEANFFQQLFTEGYIGEFGGPFPLLDTAPLLMSHGYNPTSEESFANAVNMTMPEGYVPHSALSDALLTAEVWQRLS